LKNPLADGNRYSDCPDQNQGYSNLHSSQNPSETFLRQISEVMKAMLKRHETYNRQLALGEQLERDGKRSSSVL
jgi:hypothetical protein